MSKMKREEIFEELPWWQQIILGGTAFVCLLLTVVGAADLFNWIRTDISLEALLYECDPNTPTSYQMDYMVLGSRYTIYTGDLLRRRFYPEAIDRETVLPSDITAQAHYIELMQPNHPSLVELYSRSADKTWFLIYPDDFNRYNTQACGLYQEVPRD